MLPMSSDALAIVQRSFAMNVRVESWLGGELLAADVPASDGGEDRDRSLTVPERVTLTVPRRDRGTTWDPGTDGRHPLAAAGQQIRVSYGVDVGGGMFEWIPRGWFVIADTSTDADTVTVTAEGLLTLIDEAKLAATFQPAGTLVSTVRALVEPALTVQIDPALTNRSVPTSIEWDTDRMNALSEVLDAWPAQARVTEDGYLLVEPVSDSGSPVLAITDGAGGTVSRWQGSSSRDGAFNCVIAQGETSTGLQIQGVAYDYDPESPYRVGGPFNPLLVPATLSSPLLTTVAQCQAAAVTRLASLRKAASRKIAATCVPHPGLITGDVVAVTGEGLTAAPCVIEALSLPYSPGEMSLTLRVL